MDLHEACADIHKSIVASSPGDVSPLASVSRKLRTEENVGKNILEFILMQGLWKEKEGYYQF